MCARVLYVRVRVYECVEFLIKNDSILAKSHKCHVCDFSTSYPEKLRRHIKAHVNRGEITAAEMVAPTMLPVGSLIVSPGSSASDSMAMLMISPAASESIDRRCSLPLELGEIPHPPPTAAADEGDESNQGAAAAAMQKSGASTPVSSAQNSLLQSNWLQQMAWYQQLMASQLGAAGATTATAVHAADAVTNKVRLVFIIETEILAFLFLQVLKNCINQMIFHHILAFYLRTAAGLHHPDGFDAERHLEIDGLADRFQQRRQWES